MSEPPFGTAGVPPPDPSRAAARTAGVAVGAVTALVMFGLLVRLVGQSTAAIVGLLIVSSLSFALVSLGVERALARRLSGTSRGSGRRRRSPG